MNNIIDLAEALKVRDRIQEAENDIGLDGSVSSEDMVFMLKSIIESIMSSWDIRVTGFAILTFHADGCVGTSWGGSADKDLFKLLGALEHMKHRIEHSIRNNF